MLLHGQFTEAETHSIEEHLLVCDARGGIEIRANGPFVLQPIHLHGKALTLRAGAGARPVIALAPEAVAADLPLLTTRAALTLEGLEFHRDAGGKPGGTSLMHIHSMCAPLAVANCRFVLVRSKTPGLISATPQPPIRATPEIIRLSPLD
jgi:hypothetical protein